MIFFNNLELNLSDKSSFLKKCLGGFCGLIVFLVVTFWDWVWKGSWEFLEICFSDLSFFFLFEWCGGICSLSCEFSFGDIDPFLLRYEVSFCCNGVEIWFFELFFVCSEVWIFSNGTFKDLNIVFSYFSECKFSL